MTRPVPFDYQREALDALAESRSRGASRALAVMASGLGKTLVSAFDVAQFERVRGSRARVLYLSERNVILEQAEQRFRWVLGSDRSFGQFNADRRELEADLVFATFQSLFPVIATHDREAFDYLVVDEAHHTAAPTHGAVVSHLSPRFMLGLTATPFRGDGQDIRQFYGDEVAVSLPLERALAEGLLTPIDYRVYTDEVDESVLHDTLEVSARGAIGGGFAARNDGTIVDTILEEALVLDGGRRIVVFCASLEQMHHFARLFPSSDTISGDDGRQRQMEVLAAFERGEFEVLLSRDVLNEGADMPKASTLVFLRNTESPVVFLQQLGRGLRRSPGKEKVVVLDFVDNIDRIEFVYAFYSRLQAEQQRQQARRVATGPTSALQLDEAARSVIRALIARKRQAQLIVDQHGLQAALDYQVGMATLRRLVASGRLVPDYVDPDGRDMLFERPTYEAFLRQVWSPALTTSFVRDRAFAAAIGRTLGELRRMQQRDQIAAAWVHMRPNHTLELLFERSDQDDPYHVY